MRPSSAKRGPSRQRPVSCHFCRSRKLRCSRQFPCSNCTTRGINCQIHTSQALPVDSRPSKENESNDSNSELLARLQRLEDIVMRKGGEGSTEITTFGGATSVQTSLPTQQHRIHPVTTDSEWLERECMLQHSSVSIVLCCHGKKYIRR